MTIRAYRDADFDALYRLDQRCYPPGIAYSRFALHAFLSEPGAQALVAYSPASSPVACPERSRRAPATGSKLLGFVLVRQMSSGRGHIITLDVEEAHRRRGLGTALLAAAERWLAAQGVARVRLETAADNHPAVAFWQKAGYRLRRVLRGYYLGRLDAYEMEKELTAPAR